MAIFFRNYVLLPVGLGLLVLAVMSIATGKVLTKYGPYGRSEQPGLFWSLVVSRFLAGGGLIFWQIYLWIAS